MGDRERSVNIDSSVISLARHTYQMSFNQDVINVIQTVNASYRFRALSPSNTPVTPGSILPGEERGGRRHIQQASEAGGVKEKECSTSLRKFSNPVKIYAIPVYYILLLSARFMASAG